MIADSYIDGYIMRARCSHCGRTYARLMPDNGEAICPKCRPPERSDPDQALLRAWRYAKKHPDRRGAR